MKARLIPVYFPGGRDAAFDNQMQALASLLMEKAELLPPVPLGSHIPEADAVIFPQMLGDAYRHVEDLRRISLPMLVVTSESATFSMWDWEIISYLKGQGIDVIAPYDVRHTRVLCGALALKRALRTVKFIVYQDNPGVGAQANIFKRFYWWEDECVERIRRKFGITVERRSFRELSRRAENVSDVEALKAWESRRVPTHGLSQEALLPAMKLYLAIKADSQEDKAVRAIGINCLNESHFSRTTPCLAWDLLFEDQRILWGCEADVVSMVTEYILYHSLESPVVMTNLYPFLMGDAALKHERIDHFPPVPDDPANYVLVAHCGYMGLMPRKFATKWMLRKRVLKIVHEDSVAIDAELPLGPMTLAKLHPDFATLTAGEGELVKYVGYPGSDCLNGGLIRVADGHRLMRMLCSHHAVLLPGKHLPEVHCLCKVFELDLEQI